MVMMVTIVLQLCGSGALLPFDAMPDFFRIGYGLPLKSAIAGAKAIILGSLENDISEDVGILWAWLLGLSIMLALGIYSEEVSAIMSNFRLHLFDHTRKGETDTVDNQMDHAEEKDGDIEAGVVAAVPVDDGKLNTGPSKYGSRSIFMDGRPKLRAVIVKGVVVEVGFSILGYSMGLHYVGHTVNLHDMLDAHHVRVQLESSGIFSVQHNRYFESR